MKKKALTILAISVIMIFGLSVTLIAQNMVTNPGFENWTGGEPDDWTYESGVSIEQETITIHGGTSSAEVILTTQTQGNTDTQNTEFAVTPGVPYTYSVWVYDNDPAGRVSIVLYWNGASTTWTGVYSTDQDSWQQLEYIGSVPDGAAGLQVGFRFYDVAANWDGDAIFYLDAVNFEFSTTATIVKAYSISENAVDVFYNADLTEVNAADYTLTGTETITFSDAAIDGTNSQLVHLTGSSLNMIGDITLDNIYDSANDTDYDFYAGITPIALTNTLNPDGHIIDGELATFQGIVSANDEFRDVWISDSYGPYNGVLIYDYDFDGLVAVGDEILFVAKRDEYSNLTELKDPILLSIISSGNEPYPPALISGSDIESTIPANTNPAEQWEGQLVAISGVLIASIVSKDDMYIGSDDDWLTTFVIGDNVDYQYENIGPVLDNAIASGEPIDIKGVVDWNTYENYYRINPRTIDDLLDVEDQPNPANSFVLYQNYPNPVISSTTISFSAADLHRLAQIEIYNVNGQLIKQFPITNSQSSVEWEGTDESGKPVSNGIYLYKLIAANKSITKKMLLLR